MPPLNRIPFVRTESCDEFGVCEATDHNPVNHLIQTELTPRVAKRLGGSEYGCLLECRRAERLNQAGIICEKKPQGRSEVFNFRDNETHCVSNHLPLRYFAEHTFVR